MSGIAIVLAAAGTTTAPSGGVSITNQSVTAEGGGPQTATYRLNTSGIAQSVINGAAATLETWLSSGASSDYEARATVVSGTLSTGTTGSWLALSSSQEWSVSRSAAGSFRQAVITVEIREAASPFTVLDSAQITLIADVYSGE